MTFLKHTGTRAALWLLSGLLLLASLPLQAATSTSTSPTTSPSTSMPAAQCERPGRLRFSVIPLGDSQENQAAYKPLADELQQRLHIPVELVTLSSYGAVIEGLLSGAIDLARMGPASYISASQSDSRIVPFAALVRAPDLFNDGHPAGYYSVLITRQKSAITSVPTLKGKTLSLVDPDSTSGATIPRHYFSRLLDMPFERFFSRIGYAGNHEQSLHAVLSGEVDAAFVSSSILSALIRANKIRQQDVRILWKSEPIPYSPLVYRNQLCADIKQTIRSVFFDPHSKHIAVTLRNLNAQTFVPVTDADYRILRHLPRQSAN